MIIGHELASSAVRFFERASEARKSPAPPVALAPGRVRALIDAMRPLTAAEARMSLARHTRRSRAGKWGRRGMPEHVWRAMYAEYCTGKSLSEVAAVFGGTRQSVYDVFRVRKLELRPQYQRLLDKIVYRDAAGRDRAYTSGKSGYYRATEGDRKPLHHQIWEDAHGPIPEGWQVTFRNADCADLRPDNIDCQPIAEVTRFHWRRHQEATP